MRLIIWQSKVSYYLSPYPSSPLLTPPLPSPPHPSLPHSFLLCIPSCSISFALVTSSLIHFQILTFQYSKSKHSSLSLLPLPPAAFRYPSTLPFLFYYFMFVLSVPPSHSSILTFHFSHYPYGRHTSSCAPRRYSAPLTPARHLGRKCEMYPPSSLLIHPSSFLPSSFLPSSLLPPPSSPPPSSLLPPPSSLLPPPSSLLPPPSSLLPPPSSLLPPPPPPSL